MTSLIFVLFAILLFELLLRFLNPYRLFIDKFDESEYCDQDSLLGWKPSPNVHFIYFHKYLKRRKVRVVQNSLGLPTSSEYSRKKPPNVDFRILYFGETTSIGWELSEDKRIYSLLEKKLNAEFKSNIEVIPIMARNYCSSQLYTWFMSVFKFYEYDLIVYNFNENNPRRSVTFHESGKPLSLSQPLILFESDKPKYIQSPTITNNNDMAYLDANLSPVFLPGCTDRSFLAFLRNNFHIYQFLEDQFLGKLRLRRFKDRNEIKDIEKWNNPSSTDYPYQWKIFKDTLSSFARNKSKNVRFMIVPNLQYYHAGNNWLQSSTVHPWGFNYSEIPSRLYLSQIAEKLDIEFCDIYKYAFENKIDTSSFYIHPRYAYYSAAGSNFHSDFIVNSIKNLSIVQ